MIQYTGYNGGFSAASGNTTCILGRYHDPVHGAGVSEIIANYKYKTGRNINGINILNLPKADWTWEQNTNWLLEAINQQQTIRFLSNVLLPENRYTANGKKTVLLKELEFLSQIGYPMDLIAI